MSRKNAWFDKYEVDFDRVFLTADARTNFNSYLRKSLVEETLLFLVAVEEYRSVDCTLEKMQSIYSEFIASGSLHEINIGASYKEKIERTIVPNTLTEPQPKIYDEVYVCVRRDLKEDVFPRYIRADSFKQFATSKGEEFMKEIAVDVSQFDRDDALLRPSDFNSPYITEQDVAFVKQMLKDSNDWVTMSKAVKKGKQSDHYAYISRTSYSMNDRLRRLGMVKFTGYLPVSAKEFLPAFLDRDLAKQWDKNMDYEELLEYLPKNGNEPYSCVLASYVVKKVPLFKSRKMQCVLTLLYDQETKSYLWIGKTTSAYPYPKTKEPTKWFSGIYAYVIHEINDTSCRYSHVCYLDSGLPLLGEQLLQKANYEQRAKGIQEGLMKICRTYVGRDDRPSNDLGAYSNLHDYLVKNNIKIE